MLTGGGLGLKPSWRAIGTKARLVPVEEIVHRWWTAQPDRSEENLRGLEYCLRSNDSAMQRHTRNGIITASQILFDAAREY